ncbi:MAG: hypothetical protein WC629_02820 [Candidatus Paceibacterota bacterium]|jgi:hypothetical protein
MNQEIQKKSEGFVFDKYIAIALVVGLVIGFIIGNSINKPFSEKKELDNSRVVFQDATSTTLEAGDWLTVPEQKAGSSVLVSKVTIDKPYWIAVRENKDTSKFPYILGAIKLQAGTYSDVNVFISRNTETGKKYDVIFYKDSPDFDYSEGNLVINGSSTVGSTFTAN